MDVWMDRYLDAWNSHDADAVADWMTDDATYGDMALGVLNEGRDAIRAFAAETHEVSNDFRFTLVEAMQSDHQYAARWEWKGTHTGEANGIRATHKPFHIHGASVGRLSPDGKIQENTDYWNLADLLTQIGLLPPVDSRRGRAMTSVANVAIRLRTRRARLSGAR